MIHDLVILGAGGDLTSRYLIPALMELEAAGLLPPPLTVTCVDRGPWDDASFRAHLAPRLGGRARSLPPAAVGAVLARVRFRQADVTDPGALRAALGQGSRTPLVAYLALPPPVVPGTVRALGALPLPHGSRMVVEKPFGNGVESAQSLNRLVHDVVAEEQVFRVDHFLGKQTVQNLLGLRFANRLFEPVWNAHHVERVEIVWDETLGLEGRAGYYDTAGALRDMVQNHLLQLLCLLAMEAPRTLDERDLRDRKVDVLRAVRRPTVDDVARCTVRARYSAGAVAGTVLPAYRDEPGIDPERRTETFVEVTLWIDNWRWGGVPFTLRSGKALGADRHEIAVWFKPVPHLAFDTEIDPPRNVLRLGVNPDRVTLGINLNGAGDPFRLERAELAVDLAPQELTAYARLLVDVFEGDPVLSIRADEAEEAWRIVEPILDAWRAGASPLLEYPAGSAGPSSPAG